MRNFIKRFGKIHINRVTLINMSVVLAAGYNHVVDVNHSRGRRLTFPLRPTATVHMQEQAHTSRLRRRRLSLIDKLRMRHPTFI